MHDCVSQMGCGILPPLLKSYNAILDSQPIHGAPVQHFAFCLFSVPADPICGAPLMKEMETKYPDKWQEKRRAKPVCFVSRNQKRPGRHFYCSLETKHAKNPGLFPMFPFSCVSTSTLHTNSLITSLSFIVVPPVLSEETPFDKPQCA